MQETDFSLEIVAELDKSPADESIKEFSRFDAVSLCVRQIQRKRIGFNVTSDPAACLPDRQ